MVLASADKPVNNEPDDHFGVNPIKSLSQWRLLIETALLLAVFYTHLALTPFTKVEESFNVQSSYDLLFKSWKARETFDHVDFPGVVPRTFLGPIFLTTIARIPIKFGNLEPLTSLLIVRGVLATCVACSVIAIRMSVMRVLSENSATLFILFTCIQFHLAFYSSRLLPNIFALVLTNFAFCDFLYCMSSGVSPLWKHVQHRAYRSIVVLSTTVALFRSELVLLLGPVLIMLSMRQRVIFFYGCGVAFMSAVIVACISIVVDSYFWGRLSYPELEVFYFNAIKGGSSAWGTSPWHWYWSNAIPRAIGGCFPLAISAMLWIRRGQLIGIATPYVIFVCIYSALPHKELRFIFYVIPVLNVCAAAAVDSGIVEIERGWRGRKKTNVIGFVLIVLLGVGSICASCVQTIVSVSASRWNYPAGYALQWLVEKGGEEEMLKNNGLCMSMEGKRLNGSVLIDIDSSMKGITQFVYRRRSGNGCVDWSYSKVKESKENADVGEWKMFFNYVVTERSSVDGFCVIRVEGGYAGIDVKKMAVKITNATFVHRNLNLSAKGCFYPPI